jgi:hypothetical protein
MGSGQDEREDWSSEDTDNPAQPLLSQSKEFEHATAEAPTQGEPIVRGPRVEYIYVPVFPRTGRRQDAVGILGRTKRVSSLLSN